MSFERFFKTRSCALTVSTFSGKDQLQHVDTDTGVRVYRNAPGTAVVQLRHFSGKRFTNSSASLDVSELEQLRAMIDQAIVDIKEP